MKAATTQSNLASPATGSGLTAVAGSQAIAISAADIELLSWWFMFLGGFYYHDESLWNQKWKFLCRRARGFSQRDARRAAKIGWPKIPKHIFTAAIAGEAAPPARILP